MLIKIAAGVIQDEAGRLLLVRKSGTQHFMQPGGKMEAGESPQAALRREIREEIGLEVDENDLGFVGTFIADAANEPGCQVEAHLYRITTRSPPRPGAEIAELIWLHPRDYGRRLLAPLTDKHVLPIAWTAERGSFGEFD